MARASEQQGRTDALARMRSLYAAGDFEGARSEAWAILHDARATEAEKAEAQRLRDRTEVDRRAWAIAVAALLLAAFVVVVFLL